jgi:uncharacterized membrane protein
MINSVADADLEFDSRATDRLMLFSDAVVAIAITLLAIDLPVPTGATTSAFLASVRDNWGHYGAFLISFLAIAGAWSNHHDVFQRTTRIDPRLRHLDMIWLLMIVLTPFATRFLTAQGHPSTTVHALRFGFYALVQLAESTTLLMMLRYMTAHGLSRDLPEKTVQDVTKQAYLLMAAFALSIPVLFITPLGWLLWLVVPFALSRWFSSRGRRRGPLGARRRRRADPDPGREAGDTRPPAG